MRYIYGLLNDECVSGRLSSVKSSMLIFNYLMIVSAVLICLCAEASVAFKVNRQWVASLLSTAGLILAHIISLSCFALALAASCYLFLCLQLDKHCVNKLYHGRFFGSRAASLQSRS